MVENAKPKKDGPPETVLGNAKPDKDGPPETLLLENANPDKDGSPETAVENAKPKKDGPPETVLGNVKPNKAGATENADRQPTEENSQQSSMMNQVKLKKRLVRHASDYDDVKKIRLEPNEMRS